jgi:hypothetical protein
MLRWLQRTPEFELSVVLIASPLALVVALWGMTSTTILKLMRNANDGAGILSTDVSLITKSRSKHDV